MIQSPPICILNGIRVKKPYPLDDRGMDVQVEECLSLPGVKVKVARPLKARIDGFNQYWNPVSYRFLYRRARIACHELDHGDGIIIIDKAVA